MENRDPKEDSPAPSKRSSIENLKRASRVKNSNMFAREQKLEYDPTAPPVERPLAAGRPLSSQPNYMASKPGDGDQTAKFPLSSPLKSLNRTAPQAEETPSSPSKPPGSPSKSSLSKTSRYGHVYDPENGIYSEDDDSFADKQLPPGKSLHRHAKSVTFDAAPPQINEYEMTTPVPSSIASGSREGSYDSREDDEDDEELSFERGSSMDRDDSFDASLEDTDKTPVVLPEDWRFMSPALATNELAEKSDDVFVDRISDLALKDRLSPIMDRESPRRTDSINSNGERRPLPPLPPSWAGLGSSQAQSDTTNVSQPADNLFSAQRNLPSPPRPAPMSKIELQSMGSASMSMEDRLRLMMLHDPEKPQNAKSAAEMQRERRLRRAGASPDNNMEKKGGEIKIHEDGPGDDRVAGEQEYQLPRISRESILRKVKSQTLHDDYDYSSPVPSSSPERPPFANIDRDVPIPSLEDRAGRIFADDGVMIKQEDDAESEVDVYAIPDMYQTRPLSPQPGEDFSKVGGDEDNCREEDDESHYSTDLNERENEGPPTPRVTSPLTSTEENKSKRMSLPQFASMLGQDDFGLSLSSYMTPSPPADEPVKAQQFPALPAMPVPTMARPLTPEEQLRPSIPGYGSDEEEPQTPESVIRHSISGLERSESPAIPEPSATIKAPGGLKTRASLAPADARAMAEARRKVSGDQPDIPPIPAKHKNRTSIILEADSTFFEHTEPDSQKQVKRKSSLVQLDITVDEMDEGLSFGLDREFDRLIEAQKASIFPTRLRGRENWTYIFFSDSLVADLFSPK